MNIQKTPKAGHRFCNRIEPLEQRIAPATFIVTTVADSGAGSLRQAILSANGSAGADLITFNLGTGPFKILPLTQLPDITDAVTIDGYSQSGASVNSLADGTNANIVVELSGASLPNGNGLVLRGSGGSIVRGLAIFSFGSGINETGNGIILKSSNNRIEGNFIGTDASGTGTASNENKNAAVRVGDFLASTPIYSGNIIGGTNLADRNILTGNAFGVQVDDQSSGTQILGNLIGLNKSGNTAYGNFQSGVADSGSVNTQIGNGVQSGRNVISGNANAGILQGNGTGIQIRGNYIGTNAAGTAALGNANAGVAINYDGSNGLIEGNVISGNGADGISLGSSVGDGGAANFNVRGNFIGTNPTGMQAIPNVGAGVAFYQFAAGHTIGGTVGGQGNVIAFNGGPGIEAFGGGNGNRFLGNAIFKNGGIGINHGGATENFFGVTLNDSPDVDGVTNWPQLQTASNSGSSISLNGVLNAQSNRTYRVEFFALAPDQADPSGYGEGAVYLGFQDVTSNASGVATITYSQTISLPGNTIFSATATPTIGGSTSEFGPVAGASTTYTWGGSASSDWFNAANWSPNGVPGPLDTAVYGGAGNALMLLAPVSVKSFQHTGGPLGAAFGGEMNVLTTLSWTAGTHTGGTLRLIEGSTSAIGTAAAHVWTGGSLEIRGTLIVQGSGLNFNQGDLRVEAGGFLQLNAGITDADGASTVVTASNFGSIEKFFTGAFGLANISLANSGTVVSRNGGNFTVGGFTQTDGALELAISDFTSATGIFLGGGVLRGNGIVTGNVTNDTGTVLPGFDGDAGRLTFANNLTFNAGGRMKVDIGGVTAGTQHDQIVVTGTATLNGTLEHQILGNFVVRAGDSFLILDGATRSGTFATVSGLRPLAVQYSAGDVSLAAPGFIVTNTDDSGSGSLREAILDANAQPGLDTISFSIPGGGVQTISPLTPLPAISEDVVIDAYSQPGAVRNTLGIGSNAVLLIELSGASSTPGRGMDVSSGKAYISGLIINRWANDGIRLANGADGSTIVGNWVGLNSAGTAGAANPNGLFLNDAAGVRIGTADPRDRNVISGNTGSGIAIVGTGATGNIIQGNYIGTTKTGGAVLGNQTGIAAQGDGTIIGGANPGEGNVISGSTMNGIQIGTGGGANSVVQGNLIGTNATGTLDFGNGQNGVQVRSANVMVGGQVPGAGNVISGNGLSGLLLLNAGAFGAVVYGNKIGTAINGISQIANNGSGVLIIDASSAVIGGELAGQGNIIALNGVDGVTVDEQTGTATGNNIRGNSIFSNSRRGINLDGISDPVNKVTPNDANDGDTGPNNLLNFPVLASYTAGILSGTYHGLGNTGFTLDFYADTAADPSGNGEGRTLLATTYITTNGFGNATFSLAGLGVSSGFITATATDDLNSTSEFSNALAAVASPLTYTWDAGGGADTNWFNAVNWSGDVVPGAADTAELLSNFTVTLNAPVTIANFRQADGTVTGGGSITITSGFAWTKGTFTGPSTLTISPGATATLSGPDAKVLDRRFLDNQGTVLITGAGALQFKNGPLLTNSGVLEFQRDSNYQALDSIGATFTNSGTVRKSGGTGSSTIGLGATTLTINNTGTFDAESGTLAIAGGGTFSGSSLIAKPGTTLRFATGNTTLNGTTTVSGGGIIFFDSGSIVTLGGTLALSIPSSNSLKLAGTLNGSADLAVAGVLDWVGGSLSGTGKVILATGSVTNLSGGPWDLGRTLDQAGTLTISSGADLSLNSGAVFNNTGLVVSSGANFTIDARSGGGGTFRNLAGGTFRVTGTGQDMLGGGFDNDGTVLMDSGADFRLGTFAPGSSTGGTWNLASGSQFTFDHSGTTYSLSNATFSGAGTVRVQSTASLGFPATTTTDFNSVIFSQSGGNLVGPGTATMAGATSLTNTGIIGGITLNVGGTLANSNGGLAGGSTFNTSGTSTLSGGFTFADGSVLNNTGALTIPNGAIADFIAGSGGGSIVNGSVGSFTKLPSGNNTAIQVPFTNSGAVVIEGSMTFTTFTQSGTSSSIVVNGVTSGAWQLNAGTFSGTGAHSTGSVTNAGATVRPGGLNARGTLHVNNYEQQAGATLEIEIAGTGAGQFDVLDLTGASTLGGGLSVDLVAPFNPTTGNTFRVVTGGPSGNFATFTGDVAALTRTVDASGVLLTSTSLTYVWDNSAANGDWFNPLNWNLDSGVPGAGDTAILSIVSTINLSTNTSVGTFQQSNGTFTSATGVTFTVLNAFNWTVGTQSGAGSTIIDGTLTVSGAGAKSLTTRTLINNGMVNLSGADVTASNATITNNGVFNAVGAVGVPGSGSGGFTNSATGTLNKSGAGTSAFYIFTNAGTVNVTGGTLNWPNGFTQTAGSTVLSGGNITGAFSFNFNGGELRGTGSIGTGATLVNNGAIIRPGGTGVAGTLTIAAFYNHNAGARLELEVGGAGAGQFDVLAVTGSASLIGPTNVTLLGGFTPGAGDTFRVLTAANRLGNFQFVNGPLVPQYNPTNVTLVVPAAGQFIWDAGAGADTSWFNPLNWSPDGVPGATDSATLGLNAVGISSTTTLPGNHSVGTLIHNVGTGGANNSILNISTGVTLTVLTNFTWRGGTESGAGTLTVAPGATFSFPGTSGQGSSLSARILNLQGTSTFSNTSNETISFSGGATINNSGNLEIRHGLTLNQAVGENGAFNNLAGGTVRSTTVNSLLIMGASVPTTNAGIIRAELGTLQFNGITQTAGSTQLAGGAFTPGGIGTFFLQGGEVTGVGVLNGGISNTGGVVRPGGTGATGTLTLNGSYFQSAAGTIELEIAGTGAGQFDVLAHLGSANLNGTLNAPLLGGFTPAAGNTFRVLDPAGSVIGTFATVNSPLTAQYSAGDVTLVAPAGASPFVVTTTLDVVNAGDGVVSLREAITSANSTAGTDTITFNISGGGVQTIAPTSMLPIITEALVIDGYSQPGASANTLAVGSDAVLLIELDGTNAGNTSGLTTNGDGSTIRGLVINRFANDAIALFGAGPHVVEGCFIGTDASGTTDLGNGGSGIEVFSPGATIGGTSPAARNVISGNAQNGILLTKDAPGTLVAGNYLGLNAAGTAAIANTLAGLAIESANNTIGGTTAAARNVISGNGDVGISIKDPTVGPLADGNTIAGNWIGLAATGAALGNGSHGIRSTALVPVGTTIGGTAVGAGNVIANNGGAGVVVQFGAGVTISRNSIFQNTALGLDLDNDGVTANDPGDSDTGTNNGQNFPVIASAIRSGATTTITGNFSGAPLVTLTLEFFASPVADPSGFGEGATFLGSTMITTDGTGAATFNFPAGASAPAGSFITATATEATDGTSEFSAALVVASALPLVVTTTLDVVNAGDGVVSLREAITFANVNAGTDTITFNIAGTGPFNIPLASALPAITDPIVIDGYTQPGSAFNESLIGNDAVLLIQLDGSGAGAGADGLHLLAANSTVRGLVIGGFDGAGIRIAADGNVITGNFIGTDATGTAAFGNTTGIFITSSNNTVGGISAGARNLISGNTSPSGALEAGAGIVLSGAGAEFNTILNNYIGTNAAGTGPLANSKSGIGIYGGPHDNVVGGIVSRARNIISGNNGHGVDIAFSSPSNGVYGNYIGLGADGVTGIGNTGAGVLINFDSDDNIVGGGDGAGNVISANFIGGVAVGFGSASNSIVGNFIGTSADGLISLANSQYGITINAGGAGNLIGGTASGARNFISGGGGDGIRIEGGTSFVVVQGNTIGLRSDAVPFGDTGYGVRIESAGGNTIGGFGANEGNIIANDRIGVAVIGSGSTGNRIVGNTFISGVDTPIDLGDDEDDDNDPGDTDTGPNNRQNFPVLTGVNVIGGSLGVIGRLDTLPGSYTVQLYRSNTESDFGHGDGTPFATFPLVVGGGVKTFAQTISAAGVGVGEKISAIVVNDATGDTSEFSLVFDAVAVSTPGLIRLSDLDGTDGFAIPGLSLGSDAGVSVAGLGDINGDGLGDFAIGAPGEALGGVSYVIFGTADRLGTPFDLATLSGANGFSIVGGANSRKSGFSVSSLGDLNGDGVNEILVGDPEASGLDGNFAAAYVVFGKTTPFESTVDLSLLNGTNGFRLVGVATANGDRISVASAGDLNNDGATDIIVGMPDADFNGPGSGVVYVLFGIDDPLVQYAPSIDLAVFNGTTGFRIVGQAAGDAFGAAVSTAGDINRDGFGDIIIGAPKADGIIGADIGTAYVFFGKKDGYTATIDLASLNGKTGFKIEGTTAGESLGSSVSSAGDVTDDGFGDLVIGAVEPAKAGVAYVVFGKARGFKPVLDLSTLNGANGFRLTTASVAGTNLAPSVGSVGDFNNDGFDDILIGTPLPEGGAGITYLVFGRSNGFAPELNLETLNGTTGFRFVGAIADGQSGASVSGGTDLNIDGFDDIIIGAPERGTATLPAGKGGAYVIYGHATRSLPIVSASGTSAKFSDVDGDIITVKITGGKLTADMLIFGPDGKLLLVDLNATDTLKDGANLTFSVTLNGGNGTVNVGAIDAEGLRLGKVKITGDLGQIDAGKGDPLKPALKSLTVGSLGALGDTTQIPGTEDPLVSDLMGSLPKVIVNGSFTNATFNVLGKLGSMTVSGAFSGTGAFSSSQLAGLAALGYGQIGQVAGGTTLASSGLSAGSIGSLNLKGGVTNSAINSASTIGSASITGNFDRSAMVAATSVGVVKVVGKLVGDATTPSVISARGKLLPKSQGAAIAINSLTVKGDVDHAEILIGYDRTFTALNGDASIGKVTVTGDWKASSLVAGIKDAPEDGFGLGDVPIPGFDATAKVFSRIASLIIKGTAKGSADDGDSYAITAQQVGKLKINGSAILLDKLLPESFLLEGTDDFRLVEVI